MIGAHVSTAGGLSTCVGRAQAIGAECMQIFLSAPQRWQHPKHSDEEVGAFERLVGEARIGPNFAHATYLINLATSAPAAGKQSKRPKYRWPVRSSRFCVATPPAASFWRTRLVQVSCSARAS